ncbi:hypothetical protein GQ600_5320 [Phytophthora cactorum]|nr:hypothetical protein GQ600_5320 [Phytophthora cactorum]
MVAGQHKLPVGGSASYNIAVATGATHEVNVLLQFRFYLLPSTCDRIFMQTCLRQCRHVNYVRSSAHYETVIPLMRTAHITISEQNWIFEGGINRVTCPHIRVLPPVNIQRPAAACSYLNRSSMPC